MKNLYLLLLCVASSLFSADKFPHLLNQEQFKEAIAVTAAIHGMAEKLKRQKFITSMVLLNFTDKAPEYTMNTHAGYALKPNDTKGKGFNLVTIWGETPIVNNIVFPCKRSESFFDKLLIRNLAITESKPDAFTAAKPKFLYLNGGVYLIGSLEKNKLVLQSQPQPAYPNSGLTAVEDWRRRRGADALKNWDELKSELEKDRDEQKEAKGDDDDDVRV